jgi:hypothetical protein
MLMSMIVPFPPTKPAWNTASGAVGKPFTEPESIDRNSCTCQVSLSDLDVTATCSSASGLEKSGERNTFILASLRRPCRRKASVCKGSRGRIRSEFEMYKIQNALPRVREEREHSFFEGRGDRPARKPQFAAGEGFGFST